MGCNCNKVVELKSRPEASVSRFKMPAKLGVCKMCMRLSAGLFISCGVTSVFVRPTTLPGQVIAFLTVATFLLCVAHMIAYLLRRIPTQLN